MRAVRRQWAEWKKTYNQVRPHESLGRKIPGGVYCAAIVKQGVFPYVVNLHKNTLFSFQNGLEGERVERSGAGMINRKVIVSRGEGRTLARGVKAR